MFGIQWDLVLRHLSNKGVLTSDLISDSSSWGNYYNQQFDINRGKYSAKSPWNVYIDYTTATENKVSITGSGKSLVSQKDGNEYKNAILLTTGAVDVNSKKNIYDLAGNVNEWTLEKSNSLVDPSVSRGGSFGHDGSKYTASNRFCYNFNPSLAFNFVRL